ncbi:MAG: Lrp/AsnC family transcriptional regulator [Crocinitomicaceae bacterium]|nr:Lrp/AsnC family transcriptional regulator [Crocinitomicaceae bacterium]
MNLDEIDKKILRLLQADAKMSVKDLGERVNLSTTPVFQRVKRLEKLGVIEGYSAIVNPDKIGPRTLVFMEVNLKIHRQSELEEFESTIEKMDEVLACYHITGKYDYLLKISISDMSEYRQFIMDKFSKIKNVDSLTSSITLKQVKKEKDVLIS